MLSFKRLTSIIFISIVLVACSTSTSIEKTELLSPNQIADFPLKTLYMEDDKYAGFLNTDTHRVELSSTYYGLYINGFQKQKIDINKTKVANFVLSRIYSLTDHNVETRDLMVEKSLIDILEMLNVHLDQNVILKLQQNLDKHIVHEEANTPKEDLRAAKINRQYKMQIHNNYLYIMSKLKLPIPQNINAIIKRNFLYSVKNMNKQEGSSIKGIYYRYKLGSYFHLLPDDALDKDLPHDLKVLQMKDGSFTFLPTKDGVGDVYSTRMAMEVMVDFHDDSFKKEIENTKAYVLSKMQKQPSSLMEEAEFMRLVDLVGIRKPSF